MQLTPKSNPNLRNKLFPTLARTSPVLIILSVLMNCIINPSYNSFYLLILIAILFPINWIIKHLIVQPIYKLLKTENLPLLGIGKRPPGATSCTFTLDNIPSTSFGMPSGHSQLIWTIGTYLIYKLIDKWTKTTSASETKIQMQALGYIWIICITIFILSIMVYVSYSRVYIEGCHTLQQVIIGGLLGILSGFLIYYYEDSTVNKLKELF